MFVSPPAREKRMKGLPYQPLLLCPVSPFRNNAKILPLPTISSNPRDTANAKNAPRPPSPFFSVSDVFAVCQERSQNQPSCKLPRRRRRSPSSPPFLFPPFLLLLLPLSRAPCHFGEGAPHSFSLSFFLHHQKAVPPPPPPLPTKLPMLPFQAAAPLSLLLPPEFFFSPFLFFFFSSSSFSSTHAGRRRTKRWRRRRRKRWRRW